MSVNRRNSQLSGLLGYDFVPNRRYFADPYYVSMDFTTDKYNTKAKCIEPDGPGLRFSDADTPFPTVLARTVSGTWAHVAGRGWKPAAAIDNQGPALLIPLLRPGQWELEVVLDYTTPAAVTDQGECLVGYITNSNQPGGFCDMYDANAAATEIICSLYTNDGDDTWTWRYGGAALAGAATRTYRFRCWNACAGVWDDVDDLWHDYSGRYGVLGAYSIPYTAAWAFIQFGKFTGVPFWTIYLRSLKINYGV